jgi:hypothetical protein
MHRHRVELSRSPSPRKAGRRSSSSSAVQHAHDGAAADALSRPADVHMPHLGDVEDGSPGERSCVSLPRH